MGDFEYPPGSLGAERIRLQREMDEAVAALPWRLRWVGRIYQRRARRIDAAIEKLQAAKRQQLIDEIRTWEDEDA